MLKRLRSIGKRIRKKFRRYVLAPARRVYIRKIPIAMITGTKGKTTTTRMLAHILTTAGHRVGYTSTDGIVVNGEYLNHYDSSGYVGAHTVLNNPVITAAVLETARGNLLKVGMYIDRCDAAALLNVGKEQIGIDGIDTLEQMAALKQRVINTARKAVVLNADDKLCTSMIEQYPLRRVILFSMHADNKFVYDHVQEGGIAYVLSNSISGDFIEKIAGDSHIKITSISDLPSSVNGLFPQNIANAMAAAALASGMGIPLAIVKTALQTFENTLECSPGRFNFIEGYSQTILIDSAAHVPSSIALVASLERINVTGRRVCMYETPGNRPPWHFTELGEILGPHFDYFICYELDEYRRGRVPGEIVNFLRSGLIHAGISPERIYTAQGYIDATKQLSRIVGENDLVVILMASIYEYLPVFREHFAVHLNER